jgi:hypothetical protein
VTEPNHTPTSQSAHDRPAPQPTSTATLDAVTAVLAQACPDPVPPTWLTAAAAAIADWHQQNPSPAQVIADLSEQLTTLRRDVRERVMRAVRDGEVTAASADEALRAWGLHSTGLDDTAPH